MTTPEPVSSAPDTALPEFEAFAAPAGYDNEQSYAWAAGTEHMRNLALPLLAGLRADLDRARDDVERLTAEMLMVPRANDTVITQVVEAVLAAGDWNGGIDAARRVFWERAELARVSGDRTIPDDAAERVAEALRDVRLNLGPNTLEAIYGGANHLILSGGERQAIALTAIKALGLSTPTAGYRIEAGNRLWLCDVCEARVTTMAGPPLTNEPCGHSGTHERLSTPTTDPAPATAPGVEETVRLSRSELMAGILVGIGGENDPVPTQAQLDRAVDLIFRHAQRRDRQVATAVVRELDRRAAAPQAPAEPTEETAAFAEALAEAEGRLEIVRNMPPIYLGGPSSELSGLAAREDAATPDDEYGDDIGGWNRSTPVSQEGGKQ